MKQSHLNETLATNELISRGLDPACDKHPSRAAKFSTYPSALRSRSGRICYRDRGVHWPWSCLPWHPDLGNRRSSSSCSSTRASCFSSECPPSSSSAAGSPATVVDNNSLSLEFYSTIGASVRSGQKPRNLTNTVCGRERARREVKIEIMHGENIAAACHIHTLINSFGRVG